MQAPHDENDRFFPMLNLQQQYLEEYLLDACNESPLIEVRWGNRVLGATQHDPEGDAGRATLVIDTPGGEYALEAEWNRGNTILMHREPHGIWRVDYQLAPGETPEQALRPESLKARIDAQLAMIGHAGTPWEMDWSSVYSARTLTLPDYRQGRVLFAGDAAHLLPIFGVRGANTAFQDAQSLAWHLAFVVRGFVPRARSSTRPARARGS